MRVTVLGCGSSGGVPLVGCECDVCTSDNPKNKRTRVSVLVETQGIRILIDTSPDLRQQCLRHDIRSVDAILYTHAHADHCHGIDDARNLNFHKNAPIDIYGDPQTISGLQDRFPYVFKEHNPSYGWYKPQLIPHIIMEEGGPVAFNVADKVRVIAFPQWHGTGISVGYRIGDMAYSTDVNRIPDESFEILEGLGLWIVDCLRYSPAPTHAHLALTREWITQVQPQRAVLTHMGHELEYETLRRELPDNVEPGYDGMVIPL